MLLYSHSFLEEAMFYRLARNRNFWITLIGDVCLVLAAYYGAYLIRFEGVLSVSALKAFLYTSWWIVLLKIGCFFGFDLYKGMWRYFSLHELVNMVKAHLLAFAVSAIIILGVHRFEGFSRSVFFIDMLLCLLLIGGFRVSIRMVLTNQHRGWNRLIVRRHNPQLKNMVVVGAGSAGEKLLRELNENTSLGYDVVGFVDDDPKKFKHTLHGVPVLGFLKNLGAIVRECQVQEITIAVPSASARQMRRIVGFCKSTGVPFKTLPGLSELIEGRVTASAVREVRYEDLLGRSPANLNPAQIGGYLTGKRVMVTGGAGSIGSELCRQIARYKPQKMIIVERNESGLYELELELKRQNFGLNIVAALGTIQNQGSMERLFDTYHPQTVFHAAAYKHVPMMEHHPWEAIFNNVVGSKIIIHLCATKGVERCVVVSSDKAVRPTNVMGATKRMVELITKCCAADSSCRFMAVRFGNVLGSTGSVLPLFKAQIEAGGPVTVTDPEVTRYFMTIPEACGLILQAGGIGRGNEIFVLKMGTPVKIDSMARDMITLSGFVPEKEIEIKYIGLRSGEKLYEELITEGEDVMPTECDDIMVLKPGECMPAEVINKHIKTLVDLALERDGQGIRKALCDAVPEYCPQVDGRGSEAGEDGVISFDTAKKMRLAN
jgi:FlaA1/EpsC-like NDP-sugar epimerase